MTGTQLAYDKAQINRALEASIHIGLAILLTIACLFILLPFIPLLAWGVIIAVAAYPTFKKLEKLMGGRGVLAAVLFTLALLAVLILPVFLLAGSLIDGVQVVTAHVKSGAAIIPPPPSSIAGWPLIGAPLAKVWLLASNDLTGLIAEYGPQIKAALPGYSPQPPDWGLRCCNCSCPSW